MILPRNLKLYENSKIYQKYKVFQNSCLVGTDMNIYHLDIEKP